MVGDPIGQKLQVSGAENFRFRPPPQSGKSILLTFLVSYGFPKTKK